MYQSQLNTGDLCIPTYLPGTTGQAGQMAT